MQSDAPYVAVVGGANIDIHARPYAPLTDHDSNPGNVRIAAGGVARNVAENLARLGVDTRLVTALGNDAHGQMLLQSGGAAGIDMEHVQVFESTPTSRYVSVLDDRGEMQVAIADMDIVEQLGPERLQPSQAMLNDAALIVLDTNLDGGALAWLADTFADRTLFVDTVSSTKAPRIKPHLAAVHTLKTSQVEAEALSDLEAATESQLGEVAQWLHAGGVQRVFITLGGQGVYYSTGESRGMLQPVTDKHEILNTGGAGDAFLAGLARAWLDERTLEDSLRLALAAAEITLSHPGTNNPTLSLETVNARLEVQRD